MSQATPNIREFAERLLAHEMKGRSGEAKRGAFLVCGKMRPQLANLLGSVGFRVLLARAVALASKEVGWLRGMRVEANGTLECGDETGVDGAEMAAGEAALVSHLLGLLVTFIGDNLTVRLVHGVWPELSQEDLDSINGGKDEKEK